MAANCAAIENAGKWRGSLPGCTTSADSSLDGNTTSRTSSASSTLPAFTCCSDIYETSSNDKWWFTEWRDFGPNDGGPAGYNCEYKVEQPSKARRFGRWVIRRDPNRPILQKAN